MRLNVGIQRRWFLPLGTALLLLGGAITSPTAAVVSTARVAPSASGATRGGGAVPVRRADVSRMVAAATSSACGRSRPPCRLVSMVRDRVGGGLIEDTFTLQVGPGPHDRFRLHHIARAGKRRAAKRAVFLVHGDVWGFDAVFAHQRARGRSAGVAGFLASRGVDVWGIDQRWTLVSEAVQDTNFMHGWGFATELSDLRVATTVARSVRTATGARRPTMGMVGWSRGGQLAYAYAGAESQLPTRDRNVDALVPVDAAMRYAPADEVFRRGLCESYRSLRQAHNASEDAIDFTDLAAIGSDALVEPDAAAEPGLTNRQLADLVGSSVNGVFNASFHFVAPTTLDADGLPLGLRYTSERVWFHLLSRAAAKESIGNFQDGAAINCGKVRVPFADHLSDIGVPVLYLAAAGGFGETGLHTLTLLESNDVTTLIVHLQPSGHEAFDFGHVDLWTARNAPALAWAPLLAWVRHH